MEVAGVVRFKHGAMWKALKALGWSQTELAQKSGLSITTIGTYINMKTRPSEEIALRIEIAFAEAGQYVDVLGEWPKNFRLMTKGEISIYRKFSQEQLTSPDPREVLERKEMAENALARCTAKEQELLRLRYWEDRSMDEIAEKEGCSGSNIGHKIQVALRKIRRTTGRRITFSEVDVPDDSKWTPSWMLPPKRGWLKEHTLDPLET